MPGIFLLDKEIKRYYHKDINKKIGVLVINQKQKKSVLLGNGINIQFGGKAYSNRFIMSRIIFNARCDKYDDLFEGTLSGKEIEQLFQGLLPTANAVLDKKYDEINTGEEDIKEAIQEFKVQNAWRGKFEHYYDIPLEDWFLLFRLFFLANPDLKNMWKASKAGLEWIILDAIYNDGRLQEIHHKMKKSVKHFFKSFDSIFTVNYDNNIELLTNKTVYHLHGDYSVLADSENPEMVQGFLNTQKGQIVMNPEYPQCYCNALLNFSGHQKYKEAQDKLYRIQILRNFRHLYETDINEFKTKRAEIERQNPAAAQVIDTYIEHPELKIASDYHFSELENLSGELYIMGLSPQNDSHIFSCIEKSSVEKVIFYFYGEPPRKLPLTKPYEFKDIKKLWKSLDANIPQYNCGRKYPNSDQAKKVFDVLNVFSLDPITKEEMEKEANAIPDFIVKPLYREAMDLMETFGTPKDEEELLKQARMVSRIALREGIFPSVLYLFIITVKEK